ncbi:AraC family transcriptional regulator [Thiotrichales bacterium 19S3-7]|nr:AraC family transcriptional regulator [Thiotrichales bacterium 19S3-7]MCF6802670.1 AraC family transcriptional regulator [Thiotrichales bacterium 19S3-11]
MFQSTISIPSYCIRQILTILTTPECNAISQFTIDEKKLNHSLTYMPWKEFYNLLIQAKNILKHQSLGLVIGDKLLTNTHGILGFAMMNSTSLRHSVTLLETYLPLRTNLISIKHQIKGDYFLLKLSEKHPLNDVKDIILEAVTLALKHLIDYITMNQNLPISIAFSFAKGTQSKLAYQLFQCDIHYDQSFDGILIPLALIDKPLPMADAYACSAAIDICQKELEKIEKKSSISQQIYNLLLENQGEFPSLEVIAENFHLSARTLHRRLLDENTSYRDILDKVKHTLATAYLRNKQMTIQEIAFNLGYHDVANFRRAFKRWEGIPPSKYLSQYH